MKKSRILTMTIIASLAAVSSAFAYDFTDNGAGVTGNPAASIKPSKNVTVTYTPGAATVAPATGVVSYGIATIHSSGTKTFGSTSGDTKIFMKDGITGNTVAAPAVVAGVADSGNFTGWSAM